MTPKRFAELKQSILDFPHIAPTNAEARELVEEVERLRGLMPEVYGDGYQAGVDGDESDVLEVAERLDAYLAAIAVTSKETP